MNPGKNNDTLQETDIKRVYGETIFSRGQDYFDDERVTSVIKFRNKLSGGGEGILDIQEREIYGVNSRIEGFI